MEEQNKFYNTIEDTIKDMIEYPGIRIGYTISKFERSSIKLILEGTVDTLKVKDFNLHYDTLVIGESVLKLFVTDFDNMDENFDRFKGELLTYVIVGHDGDETGLNEIKSRAGRWLNEKYKITNIIR